MYSLTLNRIKHSTWTRLLAVLLFTTATAVSARVSVLLPFSPIPLTMQVLVVVLSGLALGPVAGFAAQALYLQAILMGAPLAATGLAGPAAFMSPTAGYLLAFPVAAAAAGWLSQRTFSRKIVTRALGSAVALAVIYTLGTGWLSVYVGGLANAWKLGVAPFIGADALKVVIAVAALSLRDRK